jgi:hypothetical protein
VLFPFFCTEAHISSQCDKSSVGVHQFKQLMRLQTLLTCVLLMRYLQYQWSITTKVIMLRQLTPLHHQVKFHLVRLISFFVNLLLYFAFFCFLFDFSLQIAFQYQRSITAIQGLTLPLNVLILIQLLSIHRGFRKIGRCLGWGFYPIVHMMAKVIMLRHLTPLHH